MFQNENPVQYSSKDILYGRAFNVLNKPTNDYKHNNIIIKQHETKGFSPDI